MDQVSGQVKEIKKLVLANQDTLLALHTNRDKPEIFYEVIKKIKSKYELHIRSMFECQCLSILDQGTYY